jgi:hypothetical protein
VLRGRPGPVCQQWIRELKGTGDLHTLEQMNLATAYFIASRRALTHPEQ